MRSALGIQHEAELFVLVPPVLLAVEHPVFQALAAAFDQELRLEWFAGLALY